jgi:RNA-directed DNA polymerase
MSKGAGKSPRVISIPTARDRIALKALANCLSLVYPDCRGITAHARVEDVREALATSRYDSYVRVDVREFYPSISHNSIERMLARRTRKREFIDNVMRAVQTPTVPDGARKRASESKGVPQGLSISNIIAEVVASYIDTEMLKDERCQYFRFVDDILLLCNSAHTQVLFDRIAGLFRQEGLRVHDLDSSSKSSIGTVADGFNFLGYVFKPEVISARPSSIRRVESSLARSFTKYKNIESGSPAQPAGVSRCQWYVDLTITGCVYKGIARGWLNYFRQMDDLVLLKKLDATVNRFQRRFDMPPDFQPKSFMRAYWAIRHPRSRDTPYIPNFDNMSPDQTREILTKINGEAAVMRMSDLQVVRRFRSILEHVVSDLEKDEGPTS